MSYKFPCGLGWHLTIVILLAINLVLLVFALIWLSFIRTDELPRCYRITGTGSEKEKCNSFFFETRSFLITCLLLLIDNMIEKAKFQDKINLPKKQKSLFFANRKVSLFFSSTLDRSFIHMASESNPMLGALVKFMQSLKDYFLNFTRSQAQPLAVEKYNRMMGNSQIRELMGALVEDAEGEKFKEHESAVAICSKVKADPSYLQDPRRTIIAWLNSVYFAELDSFNINWWWEMEYRIRKLIAVSVVLERMNRESMNAKPMPRDIPQCLIYITEHIRSLKASNAFDEIAGGFVKSCNLNPKIIA